jgi:choline-glycine betaine transporter
MLSITAVAPGRWAVREFMIGMLAVGLVVGVAVGRVTERSKRGVKDYKTSAKNTATYQKTMRTNNFQMVKIVALCGLVVIALFIGAMNLPH